MNPSTFQTTVRSAHRKLSEKPTKAKGLRPIERSGILPRVSPLHTIILTAIAGADKGDLSSGDARGVSLREIGEQLAKIHQVKLGLTALRYATMQLVRFQLVTVRRDQRVIEDKDGFTVHKSVLTFYIHDEGLSAIGEYLEFVSVLEKLL